MIKTRIKHKRDTAANWTAENTILLNGEIAIVDDGNSTKLKIGDGSTAYNSLPFYVPETDLNNATGVIPIANGGTGATTAADACTNLGALPLSGGTLTGTLTLPSSVYTDNYTGALNLNNSNIYGVNGIYTSDLADTPSEGINFYRTATTVDSLHAKSGVLYFTPNRTLGGNGTSYKVLTSQDSTGYHTGNATSIGGASATKPAVVVTTYKSGASWYRVWSDGWKEQGGTATFSATECTVTFPKAFNDTHYAFVYSKVRYASKQGVQVHYNRTTTNVKCIASIDADCPFYWYACGY